jgi:predicted nucleic acid-binding protein
MVLVDTSAWYALLDSSDRNHRAAADRWGVLLDGSEPVTHSHVVVEATALVQRRLGSAAATELHRSLLPAAELVVVDALTHHRSVERWLTVGARGLSLVDCTSFTVMESLAIESAFAYDPDFAVAGFTVVT